MRKNGLLLILALTSFFPAKAALAKSSPIGFVFKSCGPCDQIGWAENGYQRIHFKSCDVIGYSGQDQVIRRQCDPNAPSQCNSLELTLLNEVSLGQLACDTARAQYAAQSCGELGWPDCELFSD